MKKTYRIEVDCANCANKMEDAANKTEGVKKATVNFMTLKMTVEFCDGFDPEDVMPKVLKNCKKAESDDIYARLEKGESFEALIAEYGTDSGMTSEDTLKEGYLVHKDSIIWDPAFIAAAFSDKMNQPGDTSDPAVGNYGVHILHYLKDVPGGFVELSEAIHEEIYTYLVSQRENQIISEALEEWQTGHEIVLNEEIIDSAKTQAASDLAQAQSYLGE